MAATTTAAAVPAAGSVAPYERLRQAYTGWRGPTLAVLGVFVALHLLRLAAGWDSCAHLLGGSSGLYALLVRGHWWQDEWHASGCMVAQYMQRPQQARQCLEGGEFVFVGDSRMRLLYESLVQAHDPDFEPSDKAHSNLEHTISGPTTFKFFWEPELQSETLTELLKSYSACLEVGCLPSAFVFGAGLWALKRQDPFEQIESDLLVTLPKIADLARRLPLFWVPVGAVRHDLLVGPRVAITNQRIRLLNQLVDDSLARSPQVLRPSSIAHIYEGALERTADGLHFDPTVQHAELNVLLNAYCHGHTSAPVPRDASCCVADSPLTPVQLATFALLLLCCCGLVLARFRVLRPDALSSVEAQGEQARPQRELLLALGQSVCRVGLVMAFLFVSDRTPLFLKDVKEFTWASFFVPLLGLSAIAWLSLKETAKPGILNRDQTNEWKGWMQVVFLVYHYVGASQVLPIYVLIRVFVASYLFLTGYGHFCYFYKKADFGPVRLLQVLVRVNLFAAFLCAVMAREYQFYYFVPLSTFWFLAVYVTMAARPNVNPSDVTILLKMALLTTVCTVVWWNNTPGQDPVIAESIFSVPVLRQIFQERGRLHEWVFRSGLDRYAIVSGMAVAFLTFKFAAADSSSVLASRNLFLAACGLSGIALAGYVWFATQCPNKVECNAIHSVASPLIIVAFVVLRNATAAGRTFYLDFMAHTGTISLELFLGQYHMWLAKDTKGLLVIVPGSHLLNTLLCTALFVYAANELSATFNTLTSLLVVKADVAATARRVGAFAGVAAALLLVSLLAELRLAGSRAGP